ncbi:MAG: cytochrome-c oxidase, cbb3-type subunit III, partial [Parvularculaceae bacterium]|nr:cytochrome-c oxidase, cbb3-type subunit III [Parvularculaceae bacterium]
GHSWDGIKELNNPLPRWWLTVFYVSVLFSIGYWVAMPAWPGISGYTKGLRNHSERENVAAAVAELEAARNETMSRLLTVTSVDQVENDPELLQYTMAAGGSIFGDNCATCHGAGGQGFPGYPNLNDDSWLWGGTFDQIKQTIRYGIRSDHPETHVNLMQAFGRDGILSADAVSDMVEYVASLSGGEADPAAVERAAPVFAQQCVTCHGADGTGSQELGAPNLTDSIWLYGGDKETIHVTLMNGRGGVMPAWTDRMSEAQITALAVYVHSLGGGE